MEPDIRKSSLAVKIAGGAILAFGLTGGVVALEAANSPGAPETPTVVPSGTDEHGQAGEVDGANQGGEDESDGAN